MRALSFLDSVVSVFDAALSFFGRVVAIVISSGSSLANDGGSFADPFLQPIVPFSQSREATQTRYHFRDSTVRKACASFGSGSTRARRDGTVAHRPAGVRRVDRARAQAPTWRAANGQAHARADGLHSPRSSRRAP